MINPFYQHQVLNNPNYNKTLGDYDVWYKPCKCGYDSAKGTLSENRCWKCGRSLQRDYSDRALKE